MYGSSKKKGSTNIDDVLNSSLSKLVAARPSMEASPKRKSSNNNNTASDKKPAAAAAAMPLYPIPPDSDEDSGEFDFQKIAASSIAPYPDDKKLAASSFSAPPPSNHNSYNNNSYNRGDYRDDPHGGGGYTSSPVAKMPIVPMAPGGLDDGYEDRLQKKMAAHPPPQKKPPPPSSSSSSVPRKMTPEEKVQEKIRQENEMRNKGIVPGAVPQESGFLARPDRMEERIAQKKNEFNTGTSTPGFMRVAGPNKTASTANVQAVQTAQPQEQVDEARKEHKKEEKNSLVMYGLIGVAIVIVVVIVVVLVVTLGNKDDGDGGGGGGEDTGEGTLPAGESAPTPNEAFLLPLLPAATRDAVNTANTPQAQAFNWMAGDSSLMNYANETLSQRFAMATFYYATKGEAWTNNDLWVNYAVHECNWFSDMQDDELPCDVPVQDNTQYVGMKHLRLPDNGLDGTLPPELSWLSTLETLELNDNNLQGTIPTELGLMTSLEKIDMSNNALTGRIPAQLGQLTNLEFLYLEQNQLTGNVPPQLGDAPLQYLRLSGNSMAGKIPDAACPDRSLTIDCSSTFCGCDCGC